MYVEALNAPINTNHMKEYFVQQRPMELLQSHAPNLVSRAVQAEYEWHARHVL